MARCKQMPRSTRSRCCQFKTCLILALAVALTLPGAFASMADWKEQELSMTKASVRKLHQSESGTGYPDSPDAPNDPPAPPPTPRPPGPSYPSPPPPPSINVTNDRDLDVVNPAPQVGGRWDNLMLGYLVMVHMSAIPGTDIFMGMERPSGSHPDHEGYVVGYFNYKTKNFTNVYWTDSVFCSGHTLLTDGSTLVVGGHTAKNGLADGLMSIRVFNSSTMLMTKVAEMKKPRWYATPTRLPDGQVLIMGGTQKPGKGTPNNTLVEIWSPSQPGTTRSWVIDDQYLAQARDLFYPFNFVLPNGQLFSYCQFEGRIFNPLTGQVLQVVPSHVTNLNKSSAEYPFTGTSAVLALKPENNYNPTIMIWGGAFTYAGFKTVAINVSFSLQLTYNSTNNTYGFGKGWEMEDMGAARVMGDSILLPNNQVIILNGAFEGQAGDGKAQQSASNEPNFWAAVYNPDAPVGKRYTKLARSSIARLYHSTAGLTTDGTIVVAGNDRSKYFTSAYPYSASPTGLPEYRIEIFSPPFVFATNRPAIVKSEGRAHYGRLVNVYFTGKVTGASLVAPSSVTHAFNTHQRVVFLAINYNNNGHLIFRAPPNANIAPPGKYMLFLLNGETYSKAAWLELLA